MGDPKRNTGPQGWRPGAGPAPAKADPNYKWKQGDATVPGGGRRKALIALLFVGMVLCGVGVWVLIEWLKPKPEPGLVAVVADPDADAERLDVPIDLYGWQAGQDFLKRAGAHEAALPSPAELNAWVKGFEKYDPLIMYFGVHCGTTARDGPVLYGSGKNRVPVRELIAALKDGLPGTKKVLILDPGRLPPNPAYGHLSDDFAAQLKGLNKEIADCPNLVVMCGADVGERGWESEELQTTNFAHHVRLGLEGYAAQETAAFTAEQLFDFAAKRTTEWATRNRPGIQKPVLLPEGDDGRDRARGIDVGVRPDGQSKTPPADQPRAAPFDKAKPELEAHWKAHDRLAAARSYAHTPRAWRRYRELLLRYEAAVRAGADSTVKTLHSKLETTEKGLDRDRVLFSAPVTAADLKESLTNSNGLWAALHGGTVELPDTPTDADKRAVAVESALKDLRLDRDISTLAQLAPKDRPAEAHLPVMVRYFYTSVLDKQTPPAEWSRAVEVRRQAERAAVGLPVEPRGDDQPTPAAPAPERVWPIIAAEVTRADALRREAEDRLFGTDDHDAAKAKLEESAKGYKQAADRAAVVRTALDVRDQVTADLPFLTRWAAVTATSPDDRRVTKLQALWSDVHKLSEDLDGLAAKPDGASAVGKAAAEVWDRFQAIEAEYRDALDKLNWASSQKPWGETQNVFVTPLIPAGKRVTLLEESRKASAAFLAGGPNQPTPAVQSAKVDPKAMAAARGRLAVDALGPDLIAAQHEENKSLLILGVIESALANGDVGLVADAVERHTAHLGRKADDPTGTPNDRAERFSRLGPRLDGFDAWEPAAANHRLRWRDLLTALALRTAQDHWYDEGTPPGRYFQTAAERYMADAQQVVDGLRKDVPAAVWPDGLTRALQAAPIKDVTLPKVEWTSERERTFSFRLTVPDGYPIQGRATVLRQVKDGGGLLRPKDDTQPGDRPTVEVVPSAGFGTDLRLALDARRMSVDLAATAKMVAFFRGQRPEQAQAIAVHHQPELILVDRLPTDREKLVSVAVEAAPGLQLGSVAILVDYSGSMKGDLRGFKVPGGENAWRNGRASRFGMAQAALRQVLEELPLGTPLTIRVFSDEQRAGRVYPKSGRPAEVTWSKANGTNLGTLEALMAELRDLTPSGDTPLVRSILETAREDLPKGNVPTTLLVLTDGVDEQQGVANNNQRMVNLSNELFDAFTTTYPTTSLQVVQFAVDEGSNDFKLSQILFGRIEKHKPTPGRLWSAKDQGNLQEALLQALRPKLRLQADNDYVPEFPSGHPSWPAVGRYALRWSPFFKPGRYSAIPYPTRSQSPPELSVKDGDRMILQFTSDPNTPGGVLVQRRLLADLIVPNPPKDSRLVQRRGDGEWVLTAESNWVETAGQRTYQALTYLEKVPPHRLKEDSPPAATEAVLRHQRPEMIWWEVTPDVPSPGPLGPVVVTRRFAYHAPAWQVEVKGWPAAPGRSTELAGAKFQAWVIDRFEDDPPDVTVDLGGEQKVSIGSDTVTVRFAVEKPLDGFAAGRDCLVVRVHHGKNRPVFAKLVGFDDREAEHRYYKKADGYTAVFAGLDRLTAAGLKVKLLAVDPVRTDKRRVTINPPPPGFNPPNESQIRKMVGETDRNPR